MTTFYVTTDTQKLNLQIHVNEAGIVVAAGSPERPCLRPNFIGQPWLDLRKEFLSRGWEVV